MLQAIKHKKIAILFVTAICVGTISGMAAAAKFRGGSIKDIPNRIKEALETAKQGDIAKQYTEMSNFQKKVMEQLKGLEQAKKDIEGVIGQANGLKNYAMGLLNSKEYKKDLKELYSIDFSNGLDTAYIEQQKEKLKNMQETEMLQVITLANNQSKIQDQVNAEVVKILKMASDGVLSEKQKQAMLLALYTKVKNQKSLELNQDLMVDIAGDKVKRGDMQVTQEKSAEGIFNLPNSNLTDLRKKLEDQRLKELPK